jgi:hypothetical protein
VFAIEFTAPIWFTVLAVLFWRAHEPRPGSMYAGLAGVLVILRPG